MRTVLITNDDGIESKGIDALEEAMADIGTTLIVAPERDNSAISHALTMNRPLKVTQITENRYSIDGTPSDCVIIGLRKVCSIQPDILVSGINAGANIGDDISYSGTVAAAIEGTMYGIPSMAISITGSPPFDYSSAIEVTNYLARKMIQTPLPQNTLLNVNIPGNCTPKDIMITKQGRRLWENSLTETLDPKGNKHYWIGGGTPIPEERDNTDVLAIKEGYISITPIQLDITNHKCINFLKEKWHLTDYDPKN